MLRIRGRLWASFALAILSVSLATLAACGGEVAATPAPVIQTVVVEKIVKQTVVVEKPVEKVVQQTVVVKETTVVEKPVEKIVQQTVVVVATAAPTATPVPTATSVPAPKPSGKVRVAVEAVPPFVQLQSADTASVAGAASWGIYDHLVRAQYVPPPDFGEYKASGGAGLAEGWEVAPDLSKITFRIRKGVQFHKGYGELTARDVAFTMNEVIKPGTKNGRAQTIAWSKEWQVLDDRTVVAIVPAGGYDFKFPNYLANNWHSTFGITSLKAFQDLGPEKFNSTVIGSGPYQVASWKSGDSVVMEAADSQWRAQPKVQTIELVQLPEVAVREAAFRTGEIQIAQIPDKILTKVVKDVPGTRTVQNGQPRAQVVYFSGNYWSTKWQDAPTASDPLNKFPRPGFKPDADHPWIGDPSNPARMQSALKVRQAMSLAIDREKIVKDIMLGFGKVMYTHINILPNDPVHKASWVIPYDPIKAKQLLTEAGYPNGFKLEFWMAPDVSSSWDSEIADAVVEMWRKNLNIEGTIAKQVYAARRPQTVDRSIDVPFLHGINYVTSDEDTYRIFCPSTGQVLGLEFEDKVCAEGITARALTDRQGRAAFTYKVEDYMQANWLAAPIAQRATYFAYRPEIAAWSPTMHVTVSFNAPETIELKK